MSKLLHHSELRGIQNFSGRSSAYIRYTMVSALTASMIIDSKLIWFSSLHAIAKMHISNRQRKKRDRDGYPKNVFHKFS
jgi:hypothetical protein